MHHYVVDTENMDEAVVSCVVPLYVISAVAIVNIINVSIVIEFPRGTAQSTKYWNIQVVHNMYILPGEHV